MSRAGQQYYSSKLAMDSFTIVHICKSSQSRMGEEIVTIYQQMQMTCLLLIINTTTASYYANFKQLNNKQSLLITQYGAEAYLDFSGMRMYFKAMHCVWAKFVFFVLPFVECPWSGLCHWRL